MRGPQLEAFDERPIENHPAIRPSKNELERNAGNKAVVSFRLSKRKLDALDRIATKRNEQHAWRRFKRTELVEEAIDLLIERDGDA